MGVGQSSPLGRYPSTSFQSFQVRVLLEHMDVRGKVLDCCGSCRDAPSRLFTERGLCVTTNDQDSSLTADRHMDVTTDAFYDFFSNDTRRPDWIVSSPPYGHAFPILKQAIRVGRVGGAFKLRLGFLEPKKTMGRWLAGKHP
ncbi:unnamed protein product [Pylaiella littoralis]